MKLVGNHLQIWSGSFTRRGGDLGLLKLQLQDLKKRRVLIASIHDVFKKHLLPHVSRSDGFISSTNRVGESVFRYMHAAFDRKQNTRMVLIAAQFIGKRSKYVANVIEDPTPMEECMIGVSTRLSSKEVRYMTYCRLRLKHLLEENGRKLAAAKVAPLNFLATVFRARLNQWGKLLWTPLWIKVLVLCHGGDSRRLRRMLCKSGGLSLLRGRLGVQVVVDNHIIDDSLAAHGWDATKRVQRCTRIREPYKKTASK